MMIKQPKKKKQKKTTHLPFAVCKILEEFLCPGLDLLGEVLVLLVDGLPQGDRHEALVSLLGVLVPLLGVGRPEPRGLARLLAGRWDTREYQVRHAARGGQLIN